MTAETIALECVTTVTDRRYNDRMGERLRRLDWVYDRFPIYFVTACSAHRRPVLACAAVHEVIIDYGKAGSAYGAWLGSYVLMPDHLHAFVALDGNRVQLSNWVKSLKNMSRNNFGGLEYLHLIGRRNFSITSFAAKSPTRKSGITFATIRSGRVWWTAGRIGAIAVKSSSCVIADLVAAVYDRRNRGRKISHPNNEQEN